MKQLSILFAIVFLLLSSFVKSQNDRSNILSKDSVSIDSVRIVNEKLMRAINKFYSTNKNSMDSNTYLLIEDSGYSEADSNSFIVDIKLDNDLVNELMTVKRVKSGYFYVNNTLVLIKFYKDKFDSDLLFQKTNAKKLFHFYRRESIHIGCGVSSTKVGYRVHIKNHAIIKISKSYYIKYPYSWIQKCYYRIRYKDYF